MKANEEWGPATCEFSDKDSNTVTAPAAWVEFWAILRVMTHLILTATPEEPIIIPILMM